MRLDTVAQIVAKCPVPPGPMQDAILKLPSPVLMTAFREETLNPQSDLPEEKSRVPMTPHPTVTHTSSEDLGSPPLCPNPSPNPRTTPAVPHDFPAILALHLLPPIAYLSHIHHLLRMSRSLSPIPIPRVRRSSSSERRHPRFPPVSSVTHWLTNPCNRHQWSSMIRRPRVRRSQTAITHSPHLPSFPPSTTSQQIRASRALSPH